MPPDTVTVIGIDCATADASVGLARGVYAGGGVSLLDVTTGARLAPVEQVAAWLAGGGPALLALDAPLGWPLALRRALEGHAAGAPVFGARHELFRRATDRAIHARTGKLPLEVGADRIARTAHAALELLHGLRERTGRAIPLAWRPDLAGATAAIEVYPAATLRVAGATRPGQRVTTEDVWRFAASHLDLPPGAPLSSRHAADATVCVLAGADFLAGRAAPPDDLDLARAEGWIWVRR